MTRAVADPTPQEDRTMRIQTLQQILVAKAREIDQGRFNLTIHAESNGASNCYLTHWFKRDDFAFEDCKAVGGGTLAECLDALETYRGQPVNGRKMVDGDLNLVPVRNPQPVAAE